MLFAQIFSLKIYYWIWRFVLNAGNLLTIAAAFFLPYFARMYIIPFIYHPYRYGGIPFNPPSFFEYQSVFYTIILSVLSLFYILSGFLNVYKFCQKPFRDSYPVIFYNLIKFLLLCFICIFVLFFMPLFKYPLLSNLIIIPYANDIVNGLFWAFFVLIGVTWANISTIITVCDINPLSEIF